jgi:hypothetical protein
MKLTDGNFEVFYLKQAEKHILAQDTFAFLVITIYSS